MNNFIPLNCHSHYSLLHSSSKPQQLAERCVKLGYKSCGLADAGTISGSISFMKAMKDVCKCGKQKIEHDGGKGKCRANNGCEAFQSSSIKPIIGSEFYICEKDATIQDQTNILTNKLCLLSKNKNGWKQLISLSSESNKPDLFFKKPRLNLERFAPFVKDGNFIALSGYIGSDIANCIFLDMNKAYIATSYEEAKMLVHPNWKLRLKEIIGKYQEIFGKENFYLTIQLINAKHQPTTEIIAKALRYISTKENIPCVAIGNSYYPEKEDAPDQRVLLCSLMQTTLRQLKEKLADEPELLGFLKSNNYHLPGLDEISLIHTPQEIENTEKISEMCESYDVSSKPILPNFECPANLSPDEYLKQLGIKGWNQKIRGKIPEHDINRYRDRVKMELQVFQEAGLAPYFLVVCDYCNYARSNNWLMSPGRGSGAGCLVSMLIGITGDTVDPIKYNLLFERFYNAGRNAPGRVSWPDIDSDFPVYKREAMIEYIRNKYGNDKVAQMVTFGRMQGRGGLKDVLRAHEACGFEEMNRINDNVPDEHEIADDLQVMREEEGEASILRWALENNVEDLKQWCFIDKDGNLDGQYAKLFEQAIRLEGTKRSQGKHASGIVISALPLNQVCPMVYDKNSGLTNAGLEMNELEYIGIPKFDILGLAMLDRTMGVCSLLSTGEIE